MKEEGIDFGLPEFSELYGKYRQGEVMLACAKSLLESVGEDDPKSELSQNAVAEIRARMKIFADKNGIALGSLAMVSLHKIEQMHQMEKRRAALKQIFKELNDEINAVLFGDDKAAQC